MATVRWRPVVEGKVIPIQTHFALPGTANTLLQLLSAAGFLTRGPPLDGLIGDFSQIFTSKFVSLPSLNRISGSEIFQTMSMLISCAKLNRLRAAVPIYTMTSSCNCIVEGYDRNKSRRLLTIMKGLLNLNDKKKQIGLTFSSVTFPLPIAGRTNRFG
jgi:hypothetical protein